MLIFIYDKLFSIQTIQYSVDVDIICHDLTQYISRLISLAKA